MLLMLIKRILPFAAALALGIFIASFFVALTMPVIPKVNFESRYEYRNECRINKKAERERKRRERRDREFQKRDELVPPPPVAPAIPFDNFSVKPPIAPNVPYSSR